MKDLSIWFFANKGIFVSQNSYGYTSSFSRFFWCLYVWIWTLLKIDYKWGSHWLGHIKHWLVSKVLLARSPRGGLGGRSPPNVDPLPSWLGVKKVNHKVASTLLKIRQWLAFGVVVIAMRGFGACRNSYGFRAIWSQILFRTKIY